MILVKPSYEIWTPQEHLDQMILNIERAGRKCYRSDDRIEPGSAEPFVRGIIKRGHLSVIEHSVLTVCFTVNRGVSHELVRHRIASFSQSSTRYINYGRKDGQCTFVIPPWCSIKPGEYNRDYSKPDPKLTGAEDSWYEALLDAEGWYLNLLLSGWKPEQARELLPNAAMTEIVTTANFREWKHIFKLRTDPAAHPAMREIMISLSDELAKRLPVIFGD